MSYGSDQSRVISFWLEDIHQRRVTTLAVEASIIQIDFGTKFFTALRKLLSRLWLLKGGRYLEGSWWVGWDDLEFHVLIIKFWLYWSLVSRSKLDEKSIMWLIVHHSVSHILLTLFERSETAYCSLPNKHTGMINDACEKNLDQCFVIIFDQWKSFQLIDLIPELLYEVKPGVKSINRNDFHWPKIIAKHWSRLLLKIQYVIVPVCTFIR